MQLFLHIVIRINTYLYSLMSLTLSTSLSSSLYLFLSLHPFFCLSLLLSLSLSLPVSLRVAQADHEHRLELVGHRHLLVDSPNLVAFGPVAADVEFQLEDERRLVGSICVEQAVRQVDPAFKRYMLRACTTPLLAYQRIARICMRVSTVLQSSSLSTLTPQNESVMLPLEPASQLISAETKR